MTGTTPWSAQAQVEPIAAVTIGAIANAALFNTISGAASTYSAANMQVTVASGSITHNGTVTAVAGNVVTLVSDPTNPRWTYRYINSSGVAAIVSGSPAATPAVPDPGANPTNGLDYVQAALTIADSATYKLDKRVMATAFPGVTGYVTKYKTSTQVFTTNTTLADVTASSGTFSFAIAASEVWEVEYWIPLAFGGTGGAKFQITGPAAPTSVAITGTYGRASSTAAGSFESRFADVAAFSSDIAAQPSGASGANDVTYVNNAGSSGAWIVARIINGANAGTVTLQAAQQNSNSTTTLGIGSFMRAVRLV